MTHDACAYRIQRMQGVIKQVIVLASYKERTRLVGITPLSYNLAIRDLEAIPIIPRLIEHNAIDIRLERLRAKAVTLLVK